MQLRNEIQVQKIQLFSQKAREMVCNERQRLEEERREKEKRRREQFEKQLIQRKMLLLQIECAGETWNNMRRLIVADASSDTPINHYHYFFSDSEDEKLIKFCEYEMKMKQLDYYSITITIEHDFLPLVKKLAWHNDRVKIFNLNYCACNYDYYDYGYKFQYNGYKFQYNLN